MFDVKMLATIDADLAGAQQGDRDAQLRLMNFHVPWLLVFARTVNKRILQGFYAEKEQPNLESVEEDSTPKAVEDENVENASEDAKEGSENVEGGSEDAPETEEAEEEHVKVREADQDDSTGEDSEAAPGSPTALAEDAAIAAAAEADSGEAILKPHQVLVPHDYVMEAELYEAAGGVFFEPGFTPEGGYTAPWLINEVASETENKREEE